MTGTGKLPSATPPERKAYLNAMSLGTLPLPLSSIFLPRPFSRNRLKVYQGVYLIMSRNFREATELFLETVSTFTSTELMSYTAFVGMTVLVAVIALDRPQLQAKVEHGREIAAALLALI